MQRNTWKTSAHGPRCRLCAEFMPEHMHTVSAPVPARSMISSAHEERRRYRLMHPTPGEAALRALLITLNFRVILSPQPFEYIHWRRAHTQWPLSAQDALAEGGVGPYFCDVLIPARGLAIEVEGRNHILAAQGLTVLVLQEHHVLDATIARQHLLPFLRQ